MFEQSPAVSILLPVYNGEKYVTEAIKSALAQSFAKIELVITDNASTDRTSDICQAFAREDSRVKYSRSFSNRGLAWNHNHAFLKSAGDYVMWMGSDDVLDKDYVQSCKCRLDSDHSAVVCFTNSFHVNERGERKRHVTENDTINSARASERFGRIIQPEHWCDAIFGLMRREALDETRLHGPYADSDRVLLAELALRGTFAFIPDYLYTRRVHSEGTTWKARALRDRSIIFDPRNATKLVFPFLLKARGFLNAINDSGLGTAERRRCYRSLAGWFWRHRTLVRHDLSEELTCALKRLTSRRSSQGEAQMRNELTAHSA